MTPTLCTAGPVEIALDGATLDLPMPTGHGAVRSEPEPFARNSDRCAFTLECGDTTLRFIGPRADCIAWMNATEALTCATCSHVGATDPLGLCPDCARDEVEPHRVNPEHAAQARQMWDVYRTAYAAGNDHRPGEGFPEQAQAAFREDYPAAAHLVLDHKAPALALAGE